MTFDPKGRGPTMLGLMGVVLASALAFGAVSSPSPFWGQVVVAASLGALLAATAGAVLCTPKAFWAGLAVVGWASLLVSSELWLNDLRSGYLVPIAAWIELDNDGFNRAVRRFVFGISLFRQIVYPLVSLGLGTLAGLLVVVLTHRYAGRTPSEWIGGRLCRSAAVIGSVVMILMALRFPESLWAIAFIQVAYIALFASALRGAIGGRRCLFCGVAATVGIGLLIPLLRDRQAAQYGGIAAPANDWVQGIYTTIYPRVLDPNWWPAERIGYFRPSPPPTDEGSLSPFAALIGGPTGSIRSMPAVMPVGGFLNSLPGGGWWLTPHFLGFARVVEHLAALLFAALAGLIASTIAARQQEAGSP